MLIVGFEEFGICVILKLDGTLLHQVQSVCAIQRFEQLEEIGEEIWSLKRPAVSAPMTYFLPGCCILKELVRKYDSERN